MRGSEHGCPFGRPALSRSPRKGSDNMDMIDYTRHLLRSVYPDRVELFIFDNINWLRYADPERDTDRKLLYLKIRKQMKIKIVPREDIKPQSGLTPGC